jgi:hypothetical protein
MILYNALEKVDSHIQIPKCVLKNFANERKCFYYYDIKQQDDRFKIKKGYPNSLNVENGYYSQKVERLLQKYVESPLGEIIKYVKSNEFSVSPILPSNFREVALRYIHSLFARSPHMYNAIEQHSFYLKFINDFTDMEKNDFAVEIVLEESAKDSLFKDYIFTIFVNATNVPFILPICGIYTYGEFLCVPISHDRAIALINSNSSRCKDFVKDGRCTNFKIEEETILHQMNRFAIQVEVGFNKQYVVSSDKLLLEKYLEEMSLIKQSEINARNKND